MDTWSHAELAPRFALMAHPRTLRRYQQLALDAFERCRAAGSRRTYLVMPPGSGKTMLGLEIARRLEQRTVVLVPNTAVQAQWLREWREFQPWLLPASEASDLVAPLTVLTYQALCVLDGDDEGWDASALGLWYATLHAAAGPPPAVTGAPAAANPSGQHPRASELARLRRRARQLVVRGGTRDQLLALLHPNGRRLIEAMRAAGPVTLVLDECHHLLETWGALVRALVEELGGEAFVVGLTATPPGDMDRREAILYAELFGQADFQVPTPAVVREGDLAPYQELAYG